MSDNTVLKLSQPSTFSDPLTEVLRSGARSLLARAVEAEVAAFLDGHSEARTEEGRRRLVRHGHLPEREIMTGIGPVAVRAPRVREPRPHIRDQTRLAAKLDPLAHLGVRRIGFRGLLLAFLGLARDHRSPDLPLKIRRGFLDCIEFGSLFVAQGIHLRKLGHPAAFRRLPGAEFLESFLGCGHLA